MAASVTDRAVASWRSASLAKRGEGFGRGRGIGITEEHRRVGRTLGVNAPGDEGVLDPSQHSFELWSGSLGPGGALRLCSVSQASTSAKVAMSKMLEHRSPLLGGGGQEGGEVTLREDGNLRELGQAHADEIVNLPATSSCLVLLVPRSHRRTRRVARAPAP